MAGSFKHVLNDDGSYRGVDLLENMRDMAEAVEEMAFILLLIRNEWQYGKRLVFEASEEYFQCLRGEHPWPEWFQRSWTRET